MAFRNSPSLPWQRFDRNRESHRQTPQRFEGRTRHHTVAAHKLNHMSATRRALLERREQLGRHREWQKQNMTKMVDMDAAMRCNIASDSRVDNIRRVREEKNRLQQEQQQQTEMQLKLQRANRLRQLQDDAERLKKENEARTTIARQEKLRQSICENSHELRELEQKLNDAYTSKERAFQMQEKILELERHKAREYELTEQLQRQLEQDRQIELEMEKGRHIHQQEYQAALHGQLEDLERRKQVEYEMFLREKAMVDEIVRQINEQDEMEARRHLEKQKETKQYIEDFMEERRLWNEQEREKTEAENRKIVEYARMQTEREQQKQEKKKTQDTARTAIYDKLAAEMAEQERAKQELEDLRLELDREEQEEFERQKDMEILQSRIRKRLELIDAYQKQMQFKRVRQQKEREQEESFREKMLRKFAEDEKIELMNDQRRRMKQLEHRRAVDLLIDERRRMAEAERLEELEIERRQAELEAYKKAVVEQERQRLLREHAAKLIGYLPKGVLRDQRDLDLFDEDFRRRFQIQSQPYEIS